MGITLLWELLVFRPTLVRDVNTISEVGIFRDYIGSLVLDDADLVACNSRLREFALRERMKDFRDWGQRPLDLRRAFLLSLMFFTFSVYMVIAVRGKTMLSPICVDGNVILRAAAGALLVPRYLGAMRRRKCSWKMFRKLFQRDPSLFFCFQGVYRI